MGTTNCGCVDNVDAGEQEVTIEGKNSYNNSSRVPMKKVGNGMPYSSSTGFSASGVHRDYELTILRCIVKIQSLLRGWLARRKLTKIRVEMYNKKVDLLLGDFSAQHVLKFQKVSPFSFAKPYPESDTHSFNSRYFRNAVLLENGAIYIGEWSNDKKYGKGIQVWKDGSIYQGYWVADKACGYGRLVHVNGDVYCGDWRNHKSHGYGTYTHKDGSKYEGQWEDDLQHGEGIETWSDGATYSGTYRTGMKEGQGDFHWSDGSHYIGEFVNNDIQGYGVYEWSDHRKYVGTWKRNQMNGRGIFSWVDGKKFVGEYLDDKKHGDGIFFWPDKRRYIGGWKNGKQHGKGTFYTTTGQKKKGEWKEGQRERWIIFEEGKDRDQEAIEAKFIDLLTQSLADNMVVSAPNSSSTRRSNVNDVTTTTAASGSTFYPKQLTNTHLIDHNQQAITTIPNENAQAAWTATHSRPPTCKISNFSSIQQDDFHQNKLPPPSQQFSSTTRNHTRGGIFKPFTAAQLISNNTSIQNTAGLTALSNVNQNTTTRFDQQQQNPPFRVDQLPLQNKINSSNNSGSLFQAQISNQGPNSRTPGLNNNNYRGYTQNQ